MRPSTCDAVGGPSRNVLALADQRGLADTSWAAPCSNDKMLEGVHIGPQKEWDLAAPS